MTLYHRDVYFPDFLKNFPTQKIRIDIISYHSLEERIKEENKFGVSFLIPSYVEVTLNNLIEVEVNDRIIKKLVVRKYLTDSLDLVLVICKDTHRGVVLKTLWINEKNDNHKTLDKSKYAKE